jgi:Flp pilus assembly protein TadG
MKTQIQKKGPLLSGAAMKLLFNDEKGVSAVEFGLIAPILGFLLLAVVDFGGSFYTKMSISNGAQAVAGYVGTINPDANALTSSSFVTNTQSTFNSASGISNATIKTTLSCYCAQQLISCSTNSCSTGTKKTFVDMNISATKNLIFSYPGVGKSIFLTANQSILTK